MHLLGHSGCPKSLSPARKEGVEPGADAQRLRAGRLLGPCAQRPVPAHADSGVDRARSILDRGGEDRLDSGPDELGRGEPGGMAPDATEAAEKSSRWKVHSEESVVPARLESETSPSPRTSHSRFVASRDLFHWELAVAGANNQLVPVPRGWRGGNQDGDEAEPPVAAGDLKIRRPCSRAVRTARSRGGGRGSTSQSPKRMRFIV